MSKVFINAGHGGSDPGAVGYIKEKDVNLTMAIACKDYLEANGVEVKMSRYKDESESLTEVINECNAYNPNYAVSIHNNAGGGDGFEVFYGIAGVGKPLAQNIEAEVKAIGQNSRGLKTKLNSKGNADYYGFIRQIKCPSIIVEGFFVDNANDVKIAETVEEQKAFGVAYAKGILKTLGIEAKNVSQKTKTIDEVAKEVIAGKYGNGRDRREALEKEGYDYNQIQERVNELMKTPYKKSVNEIAKEVIAGKWGNGADRKKRLEAAGYNYNEVQRRVNQLLK